MFEDVLKYLLIVNTLIASHIGRGEPVSLPLVVNTWAFTHATESAWDALTGAGARPALDAVTAGCRSCEQSQCDLTVGFGGSPDERGETSLDAMIMDGETMNVGAVGGLVHCKEASLAARRVLEHTSHSLLVGLQATAFAREMGLPLSNLSTDHSIKIWQDWLKAECQPNFRKDVQPDPGKSCGPYHLQNAALDSVKQPEWACRANHDTISMIAIDSAGHIAAGSSSNGANHKVSGRVGDAAIPGGGAYALKGVGGCASTGDGDKHLIFLPCYQAVESMRRGDSPSKAARDAVSRILQFHPHYVGALVVVNAAGQHSAAAANWKFEYAYRDGDSEHVHTIQVSPLTTL